MVHNRKIQLLKRLHPLLDSLVKDKKDKELDESAKNLAALFLLGEEIKEDLTQIKELLKKITS